MLVLLSSQLSQILLDNNMAPNNSPQEPTEDSKFHRQFLLLMVTSNLTLSHVQNPIPLTEMQKAESLATRPHPWKQDTDLTLPDSTLSVILHIRRK